MENRNCIFYITTMLNKFFLYIVVDDLSESKKKETFLESNITHSYYYSWYNVVKVQVFWLIGGLL